jgi:large subunit ribosomal protein L29
MKADKIRELDDTELQNQEREMREQMFRLRFQMQMGQTDGLKKLRVLKKDRARILTTLRQRGLEKAAKGEK